MEDSRKVFVGTKREVEEAVRRVKEHGIEARVIPLPEGSYFPYGTFVTWEENAAAATEILRAQGFVA